MTPRASSRNDGLDLLRATGAALVFATHLWHGFDMKWLGQLAAGGVYGIAIFFPLSGYLLYRPFVRGTVDLRRYAIARVARIAPAYYLALIGIAALGLIPAIVANPLPSLTFTGQTFALDALESGGFGQSWTIGVEMAFYATLPILAFLLRPRRVIIPVVLVLWAWGLYSGLDHWASEQLPAILWAFGFGMLVARFEGRLPFVRYWWPAGIALIVVGLLNSYSLREGALVAAGAATLIAWSVEVKPRIPFARFPADISYGVYLWHMAVTITASRLGFAGPQLFVVAVASTIAVATTSYVFLERPILRWSARLSKDRGVDRVVVGGRAVPVEA